MKSSETIPAGLPPLPPVPEGFDRWEYRGKFWKSSAKVRYASVYWAEDAWVVSTRAGYTTGAANHYLEAVRNEPELLTPDTVGSKLGEAPSGETPLTSAIFKLLDQAFLHETGYEHRIALRQGARIAVEELERERDEANRKHRMVIQALGLAEETLQKERAERVGLGALARHWQNRFDKLEAERDRLRAALETLRDSTAVLNHLDPDHLEMICEALAGKEPS